MNIPYELFVSVAFIAGVIWLQFFLSKRESRWLGLILPCICFVYSWLIIMFTAVIDGTTKWEIFTSLATILLVMNIPTVVLLAIYFGCREKIKRKKAIEKMNIQDL